MIKSLLKSLLDDDEREVKKLRRTVEVINSLEAEFQELAEEEFPQKTGEFKERLKNGEELDDILPEAFALVREASQRVLGMRHFDVQLIGGMVLHQGRIAEMKTGEGKTLVATLPAYLNALEGKGVHIVTVNDYLAARDADWMGPVLEYCGLSVGLIVHGLSYEERKAAYACDVTYGTNNEMGFDYLRDNMVVSADNMVQRELHYAIIDEVDSILVDEARTPLIISGEGDKPTTLYYQIAKFIPRLRNEEDYKVDEKAHVVTLTEEGVKKVEKYFTIENLSENMELAHHVNQGLKAHSLMKRDRDYVIKDEQVIIVDEFTGRLMFGRRYSDGLHQAIEAKEGVKIEKESQTLATITFQNYFRMYHKLGGMTGTAKTEEEEFRKIYGMDVVSIPTHNPMIREDQADMVYRTEEGKFRAVVEDIISRHQAKQPVLVGTISVEKSEYLSAMLAKRGVKHQVLNAKYHEKEAQIIAQAGQEETVTIATNMAGRGTDIVLGEGIQELGGLYVLGTERHESRRIDNQLRGRSGRQGDPGESRFYVSLEDDLMRLFGSANVEGLMDRLGMDDDMPIEHKMISRAIESAQKKVEARNFSIRKNVLEYDDVINQQREVMYGERRKVLFGEDLKETVASMVDDVIEQAVERFAGEFKYSDEWDLPGFLSYIEQSIIPQPDFNQEDMRGMRKNEVVAFLAEKTQTLYEQREKEMGSEIMRELEKAILLRIIDEKWMDHIDAMDQLRNGISLRAYGQKDPLIEYKFEAFEAFQMMIESMKEDVVRYIFRVKVVQQPEERKTFENQGEEAEKKPVRVGKKIGRNDLCPCGSGKKYKKCCGRGVS
ncbi:preprotein translocase subunit SecA [Syntrophomonas wolfei]|uniref:Protein translocase subunit SecA n=2 Tax=Syntrophomonas wolfei TaxID=863 RepID=SECA_SYNWW|nr:preprotein translocase subunit SecA [Syntrophomonas wolfei]Q0B0B4.1 RecName: Full=Protein translocase subunit SecA [Syntrophomonas wolfei subsp. wolfei str. Goettingen G311]ABI67590.1 protein translocase subunit secA [Syntrophomonas wolfei subsp. wolfei str. Goettingen G311]